MLDILLGQENLSRLREIASARGEEYRVALPFPHIVIDDFLPAEAARALVTHFPSIDDPAAGWQTRVKTNSVKSFARDLERLPLPLQEFALFANSSPFIRFLESLTGITAIITDPHYEGGGLHRISPGGFLDVHADFNIAPDTGLDRRLNLLLYLNEDWRAEWGGDLELWNAGMTRREQIIAPIYNRCVVFNTTSDSHHGHPVPLSCPPDRARQSMAFYYYSHGRPEAEQRPKHSTLYHSIPDLAASVQNN